MTTIQHTLERRIRLLLMIIMIALVISGLTAMPVETETGIIALWLAEHMHGSLLARWFITIYHGIAETNYRYPFLLYGNDWLAFAHVVIAIAFIGPLMDPVRNIWVLRFGMIACVLVIPFAMIAGHYRDIPFWWRLIDCSFGIVGMVPMYVCYRYIRQLEVIEQSQRTQLF